MRLLICLLMCAFLWTLTPALAQENNAELETQITFNASSQSVGGIYVMNADGSDIRLLKEGGVALAWSSDGTQITFFVSEEDGRVIYMMNLDGSNVRRLLSYIPDIGRPSDPAWSPDGTRFAFAANGSVSVINADGSDLHTLVTPTVDGEAAWSPDGTQIAFSGWGYAVYVMNADGSDIHTLGIESGTYDELAWSPDGTQIALDRFKEEGSGDNLWVMNADGSDFHLLSEEGRDPAWSPDGTQIAFILGGPSDSQAIYVMNADGSNVRLLTSGYDYYYNLTWSIVPPIHAGKVVQQELGVPVSVLSARTIELPNCNNPSLLEQPVTYTQTLSQKLIVTESQTQTTGSETTVGINATIKAEYTLKVPTQELMVGASYENLSSEMQSAYNAVEKQYGVETERQLSQAETLTARAEPHTSMSYDIEWDIVATVGTIELLRGDVVVGYADFIISNEIQGRYVDIRQNTCP